MSIHKVECILIECDNCKEHYEDRHGFSYFVDEDSVHPEDDGWHVTDDGNHYCPDCHEIDDNDNLIITKRN